MPPVPARSAGDPPADATSSTTRHTKQADEPASVMPARSAVTTIGSSSTPNGRSTSSPMAPSGGPPQPGVPTPPNPRGTPYKGRSRLAAGSAGVTIGSEPSLGGSPSLGGGVDASADRRGPLAAGIAPQRGGTGARGAAGRRPAARQLAELIARCVP